MMAKTANRKGNGKPGGAARRGGLARAGLLLALAAALAALAPGVALGGNPNPGFTGLTDASSIFYTLDDVYNLINMGTAGTKRINFAEPAAGPGTGTGHTLDELYALAGQRSRPAKTGQTTPYDTGDDGDLEKGVAWPSPRFTDNGDGTVTDNLTGLIWLKNANVPNTTRNWHNALADVTELNISGTMNGNPAGDTSNGGTHRTDWRLPNVRELQSLTDYGRKNPALPSGHPFTGVQLGYYWSSTTYTYGTSNAWVVNLLDGHLTSFDKAGTVYVWPVRGGQ